MINRVKWLAASAAVVLAAGPAVANHQWGTYHWSTNGSGLTLTVERQLGSQWNNAYTTAIADWEKSTVLTLNASSNNIGVSARKCDPLAGKVLVCSDSYGYRGWLGIASIWANGDHITQGTTKLNDSYYTSGGTYDTPAWRSLVTCQEIGHDFGLGHQDEDFGNANLNTCMDYSNDPESNQHPNQHDYDLLQQMYAHSDTSGGGSGGGGGCNPKSPKCTGQSGAFTFREVGKAAPSASRPDSSEWGQAIGRDGAGRPDTFLLDLGNGRRKITHVFWVPGFRPQAEHFHD